MVKIKPLGIKISPKIMKGMKGGLLQGGGFGCIMPGMACGGGGCTEPQPVCCDGLQCSGSNGIFPQVGTCGGWGEQF